jgi:hypothetical protein
MLHFLLAEDVDHNRAKRRQLNQPLTIAPRQAHAL